jgi:hypothetical protein
MKKLLLLLLIACTGGSLSAQTGKVKNYQMYENTLMKPKRGHEKLFEAGVKAHNAKFHAAAPYTARLSAITDGSGSDGWYIWTLGPMMYSDLDNQPDGKKDHDDDWAANVDPHVEEYGEATLWKLQDEISYTPVNYNPERLDVWMVDIKPGMRYQFGELMKKWKGLWDAKKYDMSMRVFYNDLFSAKGKDAGIVYSFPNYAEFDKDIKWREDYEAMYGTGSYDNFWKQWNECVASTDEQLRKFIR